MAQLNPFITYDNVSLPIHPRPVNRHSPNGIARITPKSSRGFAAEAHSVWQAGGMASPWDGVYVDNDGPQNLVYSDE